MEEQAENNQLKPSSSGLCFHCGLPARKAFKAVIGNEEKEFCCHGCQTACELIYSVNAASYYKNRFCYSEAPVKEELASYPFDSELFRTRYLQSSNGLSSITVHLDNLHCPSCIWVIEKVVGSIDGVCEVSVNYTTHRATISWDESRASLEHLLNTLVKIGYSPSPVEKGQAEKKIAERNKSLLLRMVISAFAMIATMFLAEPFYFMDSNGGYFSYIQDLDEKTAGVLQCLALIITTPVFFYAIKPFYKGMISALRYGAFSMDASIFTGASLLYLYSFWATVTGKQPVYFDCLTMFLFLILLGRFIEAGVQQKIFHQAENNIRKYPAQATVIRDEKEVLVHTEEVKIDEVILVRPGEQIPVDGIVVHGSGHVDEAVITGESRPVAKKEGDNVLGGSMNLSGAFYLRSVKICADSTLKQISSLAENIQAKRTARQTFTDKVAHFFISAVLLLSVSVYIWYFKESPDFAMLTAISVLVVSCPCALGLAMPAVVSISGFSGIKKGILFKNSEALEKLDSVNHIVFDKTGTLTSGKMELTGIKSYSAFTEEQLLETASAIERYSEHPVAWSVVAEANKAGVRLRKAQNFNSYPGKGVKGTLDGTDYYIGNMAFMRESIPGGAVQKVKKTVKHMVQTQSYGVGARPTRTGNPLRLPFSDCPEMKEHTYQEFEQQIFISDGKNILGCFSLKDQLRENVAETIRELKAKNISVSLLSGDRRVIAEKTGLQAGISNVVSEVLPEGKVEYIRNLKKQGFKVAMVGDGINDAPAMAEADTGIAVFSGNDLTNMNAGVVLLNKDFSTVLKVLELAKKSNTIIRQNLALSLVYNLTVLPFAVTGNITPLTAALLMPLSSLVVLLNSIRAGK